MMDLDKIIEGRFGSLDEVLEALVAVSTHTTILRKADNSAYTGMIDQARVIYSKVYEQFQKGGGNEEQPWFKVAADLWIAEARQSIATGSIKGYPEEHIKLFERYARELYDAMNANAPLFERDEETGKFVIGGRSALSKWMKEDRTRREEEQRAKSREVAAAMGIKLVEPTSESAEDNAETVSLGDIPEQHRAAVVALVDKFAELFAIDVKDKNGKETGPQKGERLLETFTSTLERAESDFSAAVLAAVREAGTGTHG